jgi:hypothetical protein
MVPISNRTEKNNGSEKHRQTLCDRARASRVVAHACLAEAATNVSGNSFCCVVTFAKFPTKGMHHMILGMSVGTFVQVHVVISLIGIVAGLIVMFGMLGSKRQPGFTAIFLLTTILTSATGFLIPPLVSEKLLPSHMIGGLSLLLLAIACIALYVMNLRGAWRWIYALTALVALYLNVFVLVIQSFLKVPALHALAPSVPPAEPPFAIAQGIVLVFFVIVIIGVIRRYRPTYA